MVSDQKKFPGLIILYTIDSEDNFMVQVQAEVTA